MEADLLRIWPELPEDWRERRTPSFRRLIVILRYLPDDSAVATHERGGPSWSFEAQLLDEIRRNAVGIATGGKTYPPPHPLSPAGREVAEEQHQATERRKERIAASRAREAARQARLAARKGGTI